MRRRAERGAATAPVGSDSQKLCPLSRASSSCIIREGGGKEGEGTGDGGHVRGVITARADSQKSFP